MAKKDKLNEIEENLSPAITEKKTTHFGRNLVVFTFLVLCGAVAFLVVRLKQTEAINNQSLQVLQAAYEQKLNKISLRIDDLQAKINAVKNVEVPSEIIGISEELLNQKLEQLRQEFAQSSIATDQNGIPVQQVVIENNSARQTQEMLLANGAMIVRDLAEQGNSFEYETEVLQILAQGNPQALRYVDVIQKYAVSGIKGKNQLVKSFNKIFADLNMAKVKEVEVPKNSTEQSWQDKIIAWAKNFFVSKKGSKRPVFKVENDEIFTLVNEGDLGEALRSLKTSEKYSALASYPLEQWQKDVENYLEFKHAISGLIMNSLANLHLKEMEH